MLTNHIATNIITRGFLNCSILYKGFILPKFEYVITKRKGGGSAYKGEGLSQLQKDIEKSIKRQEEIDSIVVYVDWDKNVVRYDKKIYVELIKKKIRTELSPFNKDKKVIVKVELIN